MLMKFSACLEILVLLFIMKVAFKDNQNSLSNCSILMYFSNRHVALRAQPVRKWYLGKYLVWFIYQYLIAFVQNKYQFNISRNNLFLNCNPLEVCIYIL